MRDVVRILGVPKHTIIHLCNEGVVKPMKDALGRGKVRNFSAHIQEGGIQTGTAKAILAVLACFETRIKASEPRFTLPSSLAASTAPDLRAIVGDGRYLPFSLRRKNGQMMVSPAADLKTKTGSLARSGRSSSGLKGISGDRRNQGPAQSIDAGKAPIDGIPPVRWKEWIPRSGDFQRCPQSCPGCPAPCPNWQPGRLRLCADRFAVVDQAAFPQRGGTQHHKALAALEGRRL